MKQNELGYEQLQMVSISAYNTKRHREDSPHVTQNQMLATCYNKRTSVRKNMSLLCSPNQDLCVVVELFEAEASAIIGAYLPPYCFNKG